MRSVVSGQKIDTDLIILRIDGGISSQIAFLALAMSLRDRGFRLKLDVTWYSDNGLDMDGKHLRNFDLLRCFPQIDFELATDLEVYHYKRRYRFKNDNLSSLKPPSYLGGYYDRWPQVVAYSALIADKFLPLSSFDYLNRKYVEVIRAESASCAVHARRGDLSVFNPSYGNPIEGDYYLSAMSMMVERNPDTHFFLFSDDHSWVKEKIINAMDDPSSCTLVDINGAEKGYMDLLLMMFCDSYIASHGSLAKYARVLSGNKKFIIEPRSNCAFGPQDSNVLVV